MFAGLQKYLLKINGKDTRSVSIDEVEQVFIHWEQPTDKSICFQTLIKLSSIFKYEITELKAFHIIWQIFERCYK